MGRTRNTRQKSAVLAAVKDAKHHPDAKWVYETVRQDIPNVSLGTVYRALASLTAEGLITEYRQADGPSLYDSNTREHYHIRCSKCSRIEDVPLVKLPKDLMEQVRKASAFALIDQVRMEFGGMCAACAQNAQD